MGATSYITAKRLFAGNCEWLSRAISCCAGGSGSHFSTPSGAWIKRAILPMFAGVAIQSFAMEKETLPELEAVQMDAGSEVAARTEVKTDATRVVDFVLAEVRKRLDPNPETEIVELTIDPNYRGAKETYLVNAVLDAHGRKLSVGVMVKVKYTADGLQATLGYVD